MSETDDWVTVPPEVRDGLDALHHDGELHPEDREATIEAAAEREFEATVKWLEQVDEQVWEQASQGQFEAGDET